MATSRKENVKGGLGLGAQYAIGCFILLLVVSFSTLYFFEVAGQPFEKAQQEARTLARRYAELTEIEDMTVYNGEKSYYSILGKQSDGREMAVLIPQDGTEILVYALETGISQEKAEQVALEQGAATVDRIRFGYAKEQAIWEIKSGTSYYLISFETGELVKKEGL